MVYTPPTRPESIPPHPLRDLEPSWRHPTPLKASIREIAEATDTSFSTVQAQMQGRVKPSLTLVMRMSLAYDLPIDDLVHLALTNDRVRIRPTDRGRAANGHDLSSHPVWDPRHTNSAYPGMTPDTAYDEKWRKRHGAGSEHKPDYIALGMPAEGTDAFDWWQYRMNLAAGDFATAANIRANIECAALDPNAGGFVKFLMRRIEALSEDLEAGRIPKVMDRAAVESAYRKSRKGKKA